MTAPTLRRVALAALVGALLVIVGAAGVAQAKPLRAEEAPVTSILR
jgi:hypothetical protein